MPTTEQIDAILLYLDRFTEPGFTVGDWSSSSVPGQVPWFEYSDLVSEFQQALYDNGWITPSFNWGEWQEAAREYVEKPERIGSADAETIQKLFTSHVRADRFCEGHLAATFENGHIVALLRRLQELKHQNG
jgi:Family of unknown function (DUF6508)